VRSSKSARRLVWRWNRQQHAALEDFLKLVTKMLLFGGPWPQLMLSEIMVTFWGWTRIGPCSPGAYRNHGDILEMEENKILNEIPQT
jgi:hypothetical protein